MHLNHLDLPVPETTRTREFFEQYFALRSVFARADGLTVLIDEAGFALTLSPLPDGERLSYPTGFHVGFNLDSEHAVLQKHAQLAAAGVAMVRPLGELGGALTFQCLAPGPVLVEVAWRERD